MAAPWASRWQRPTWSDTNCINASQCDDVNTSQDSHGNSRYVKLSTGPRSDSVRLFTKKSWVRIAASNSEALVLCTRGVGDGHPPQGLQRGAAGFEGDCGSISILLSVILVVT
jgi:hypothetical protein